MILTQQKKCVLQAWLLLEESKAPQLYDRCLKHTRPDNTFNVKQVGKKFFYENKDSYRLTTEDKTNLRYVRNMLVYEPEQPTVTCQVLFHFRHLRGKCSQVHFHISLSFSSVRTVIVTILESARMKSHTFIKSMKFSNMCVIV
jgi:hypothetical protein